MVKNVVTLDWKSASAISLAISRPIYLSGSAKPNMDEPANNSLKLKEIQKKASETRKNAGNQKCRQIVNFEKGAVQRVSF